MESDKDYKPALEEMSGDEDHYQKREVRAGRIINILSSFKELGDLRVLDYGCGYGLITLEIAKYVKEIVGVDINPRGVEYARRRAETLGVGNIKFLEIDKDQLSFDRKSFDIVISYQVIEHVSNQDRYLKEVRRILKDDGILYLAAPNKYYPVEPHFKIPFLSLMPRFMANIFAKLRGVEKFDVRSPTYWGINRILKSEGFDVIDFTEKIIENPEQYHLSSEMGGLKLRLLKILSPPYKFFKLIVPSWIFVCKKSTN